MSEATLTTRSSEIAERGVGAVFWGMGIWIVRILLQIVVQVTLIRILGPTQFGLFATALVILTFANFFADFGLAYGIIQKKTVSRDDLRFVMTWQVIVGGVVALMLVGLAGPLAWQFNDMRLVPIIQALAGACLINAMAAPATNLLKRRLDFKRLQTVGTISYAVGYLALGVPIALLGQGAWAIVAAFLSTALINLVLLARAAPCPVQPLLWHADARASISYGITVLATNVVNWVVSSIDRFLVAKLMSIRDVGFYSSAYNLVGNPSLALVGVVQPALFSAGASIQDDNARLRSTFLAAMAVVSFIIAPVFAGFAAAAAPIVLTLYGPAWAASAMVIRPLALAMPFMIALNLATPMLWLTGRLRRELLLQLPSAALVLGGCWIAAHHSLEAVGWTVMGLFALRAVVVVGTATQLLRLPGWTLAREMARGIGLSAAVASTVALVGLGGQRYAVEMPVVMALSMAAGAAVWLAWVRWMPDGVPASMAPLMRRIRLRLPIRLQPLLSRLIVEA